MKDLCQSILWVVPVFCVVVGTMVGCNKPPVAKFHLERIGGFNATSAGSQLEEHLYVPVGFDQSFLGISVRGQPQGHPSDLMQSATNLAGLRFELQLFQGDASNDFYRAEVSLTNNCAYHTLWQPDFGLLVGGIEPFPYAWENTRSNSRAAYRYGRDAFPVRGGKLAPYVNYRLRLTVLDPIPITNRLALWLYSTAGKVEGWVQQ
jgi:hypothetical protein